jgi:hypothetical protein
MTGEISGKIRESAPARSHRLKEPAMTTNTRPTLDDTNSVRFRLLADLSHALGLRGCSSQLINPALGGAVLYVDRRDRAADKLGIGAIEHEPGWAYAWDGRWAPARALDQIAQHIAQKVLAS